MIVARSQSIRFRTHTLALRALLLAVELLHYNRPAGENLTSPRTEWMMTPLKGEAWNGRYGGDSAYVLGEFKLLLNNVSIAGWCGPVYPNASSASWDVYKTVARCTTSTKKGCLFNIIQDPTEHNDLAEVREPRAQNSNVATHALSREHIRAKQKGRIPMNTFYAPLCFSLLTSGYASQS